MSDHRPTWATSEASEAAKAYVKRVLDAPNPYNYDEPWPGGLTQAEQDYVTLTFDGYGMRDAIDAKRGAGAAQKLRGEHVANTAATMVPA